MRIVVVYLEPNYSKNQSILVDNFLIEEEITEIVNKEFSIWYYYDIIPFEESEHKFKKEVIDNLKKQLTNKFKEEVIKELNKTSTSIIEDNIEEYNKLSQNLVKLLDYYDK